MSGGDDWFTIDLSGITDDARQGAPTPPLERGPTPPPQPFWERYMAMSPSEQMAVSPEFMAARKAEGDQYDAWASDATPGPDEPDVLMFVDLLDLDSSDPVVATIGQRVDGLGLLYAGAVNGLIGDPEQGKSLVALALALQVAQDGGTVVWLDLDHNGARAFRGRVESLGGKAHLDRFRFAQPDEKAGVLAVVEWS